MTTHAPVHNTAQQIALHIYVPGEQTNQHQYVALFLATADVITCVIQAQVEAFTLPLLVTIEQYVLCYNQQLGEHGARYQVLQGYDEAHCLYGEIDNYYVDRRTHNPHSPNYGSMVWITREQWDAYMPF